MNKNKKRKVMHFGPPRPATGLRASGFLHRGITIIPSFGEDDERSKEIRRAMREVVGQVG